MKVPIFQQFLCLLLCQSLLTLSETCPTEECTCEVYDGKHVINCRNKRLTAIPTFTISSTIYDEITFSSSESTGCSLCNKFSSIPANAFSNIKVKKIDLTKVAVTDFHMDAFAGLENVLEGLLIEGAGTIAPPYTIISNLTNLRLLHLEHFLQPDMTRGNIFGLMPELQSLTLNKIVTLTQIDSTAFEISDGNSNVPKLLEFHLQNIDFTSIQVAAILTFTELTILEIMNTQITTIYGHSFQSLSKLRTLDINLNQRLATIEPNAFVGIYGTLEYLQLQQNALTTQVKSALQKEIWTSLIQLSIGYNALGTIPASMFNKMPSLQYLNLHDIQLTAVESSMFTGLSQLHTLDLSYNYITNIATGAFTNSPDLTELLIEQQNSGTTMTLGVDVFQNVEASIQHLTLSGSKCDVSQMWAAIAALPNLLELYIAQLAIANVHDYAFENNKKLTYIDLSTNNITMVKQETFYGPRDMLKTINLNENQLVSVPKCVFVDFGTMPKISLSNNQLTCDCRLLWLYDWIHDQSDVVTAGFRSGAICSSPSHLADKYLYSVSRSSLVQECGSSYIAPDCKNLYTTTVKTTTTTTTTTTTQSTTTTTEEEIIIPTLFFYIGRKTADSISVHWDVSKKTFVTGYLLTIQSTSVNEERSLGPDRTEDTFNHLQPETTYTFCISMLINNDPQPKKCDLAKTESSSATTIVPTTPKPESSVSMGVIIGGAAGAVVFVVLIIIIVIMLVRHSKPKKQPPVTEGIKFTTRTSDVPAAGGTARRFGKKPDPGKGTSADDIQVTVISNGSMDNKDRFSAGSYQFLNEKDPRSVHKNPMPSTSGGNYVNSLDNRPLPRAPGGVRPSGRTTGRGYVNTGFVGGASNMPETSVNQYSEVKI